MLATALIGFGFATEMEDGAARFSMLLYPAVLAAGSAILIWKSRKAVEVALTPAAIAQKGSDEKAAEERSRQFWERWYVRYPAAVAASPVPGSCWSQGSVNHSWIHQIAAGVLVILGAWKAREVSLVALILGGLWLIFSWLRTATLSTPAAIIIGAVIIAMAIRGEKR